MSANSDRLRVRAEANFAKAESKAEADRHVMSGIAAEAHALDVKTARLKALRLEREKTDRAAEFVKPARRRASARRGKS